MVNKNRANFHVIILIVVFFLLNLVQAANMDLSHDEAYYWIYSLKPAWGYYDHPPMVGWLIALFGLLGKSELLVRLPFALMQAGTIWLLWLLANRKNFGVFLCALLSYPLLLGSGFLALPDTPLLFFSVLFWFLAKKYERKDGLWEALLVSLAIAAMFYSKYHSLLVVLLTAASMPKLLRRKSFWAIVSLTVLFYLPHVFWQLKMDFISLKFHLTGRSEKHFDVSNILEFAGGQIALGGLFAFFLALPMALKKRFEDRTLFYNSVGFFALIFLLSFRNKIEANWTVTAFAALVPLLCLSLDQSRTRKAFYILSVPSILLLIVFRGVLIKDYPEGDLPFKRLSEVKNWEMKSDLIRKAAGADPLYADTYQIASKLSFYGNTLVPSLALGSRESQFSLMETSFWPEKDDKISYAGDKKHPAAVEVLDSYSGPIYVLEGMSFEKIKAIYYSSGK